MLVLALLSIVTAYSVPEYALTYAPKFYLHSEEVYYPSGIQEQLEHTVPMVNFQVLPGSYTLNNLNDLNSSVYLTSKEGIKALPHWFRGLSGPNGVMIVADKSPFVDVFYMLFYAYNQGDTVFGQEFGDHVGDWEHIMIRFKDDLPQAVWFSQHAYGQAFTYNAVEKDGLRPVVYIANGTHANWAKTGGHDHTIPGLDLPQGLIVDQTDAGQVYNFDYYQYNYADLPAWINFSGMWGDEELPGQRRLFGQVEYTGGPKGPRDKDLERENVCPGRGLCIVMPFLD